MKIIDKAGEWFMNTSQFRYVDGTNGNIFESGVPTKVKPNEWLESQKEIIQPCPDPMAENDDSVKTPSVQKPSGPQPARSK